MQSFFFYYDRGIKNDIRIYIYEINNYNTNFIISLLYLYFNLVKQVRVAILRYFSILFQYNPQLYLIINRTQQRVNQDMLQVFTKFFQFLTYLSIQVNISFRCFNSYSYLNSTQNIYTLTHPKVNLSDIFFSVLCFNYINYPNQLIFYIINKIIMKSSLPTIFSDRYSNRRNSLQQKPQKQGGIFSIDLGQVNGPFLQKDILLTNRKSVQNFTERSFYTHPIRFGKDLLQEYSKTVYKRIGDTNAFKEYIAQQIFSDEIQSFKTIEGIVNSEITKCNTLLKQSTLEITGLKESLKNISFGIKNLENEMSENITYGFRQLKDKLFEFSKHNNNYLMISKRDLKNLGDGFKGLNIHYEHSNNSINNMLQQFKGKANKPSS